MKKHSRVKMLKIKTHLKAGPHVNESDGGKWDFKKEMSFVLPDGTKITANATGPR